jgi:cysteine synthase A
VPGPKALMEMRRLARGFGLFVGPSSGAHMVAARRLLQRRPGDTVVTVLCDTGEKYLGDHFSFASLL